MVTYTFDSSSKTPLVFEPFLPAQDFTPANVKYDNDRYNARYGAAAQEVFLKQWQTLMNGPPTRGEYESGAWGCNTDVVIFPLFNVITQLTEPTQRDANLATSLIKWLATKPGRDFLARGNYMQKLYTKEINALTNPQWPERNTEEERHVSNLFEWHPKAFSMLWAEEQDRKIGIGLGVESRWEAGPKRGQYIELNTAQFIALEPDHYNIYSHLRALPELSDHDRLVFASIMKWLGTDPGYKSHLQNMVSGQSFLERCFKELDGASQARQLLSAPGQAQPAAPTHP